MRRVRGEVLGTKVVILSGTADDDIIREVVRAGGDAYLLKNGPARHLIDAISYVRDGGQYFSPQLRRDGLDRHLLEEQPRACSRTSVRRAEQSACAATGDRDARTASERRERRDTATPSGTRRPWQTHRRSPTPPGTPPGGYAGRKSRGARLRDPEHDGRRDSADSRPAG